MATLTTSATEGLDLAEVLDLSRLENLAESIGFVTRFDVEASYRLNILEYVALSETLNLALSGALSESLDIDMSEASVRLIKAALINLIYCGDLAGPLSVNSLSISEGISLLGSVAAAERVLVSEGVNLSEVLAKTLQARADAAEQVSLEFVINAMRSLSAALVSDVSVEDLVSSSQQLKQAILEDLVLDSIIQLGDDEYLAVVVNTETNAVFEYDNYKFNSFRGKMMASSDGIYVAGGTSDDGEDIEAVFETGFQDFGTSQLKRLSQGSVYMGFKNNGSAVVKTTVSNNGVVEEDWYEEDVTYEAFDTNRLKVHDGIRSRYWKFRVSNKDGSNLDLDSFELFPVVLSRRIR